MPVHPKILERREAVEDEYLQSRNRRLAGLLALIMFAAMIWSALHSALLDVDEVRVIGTSPELAVDIREASGIGTGDALFQLDLAEAEAALMALPGVVDATLSRSWTGVVTVDVVQRFAVAHVQTAQGVARVGDDGIVISVNEAGALSGGALSMGANSGGAISRGAISGGAISDPLPQVTGIVFSPIEGASVPDEMTEAVAVAAGLPSDLASTVDRIAVSERGVSLLLTGGATAYVGDGRQLETKFDALRAFLSQVDLRCLDEIDLQSPLVPVVRRAAC